MATTSYEKLYENVLPKFKDYDITFMSEEEAKETLHEYIIPAVTRFHVCTKDLSDRDDENECFNVGLSDTEIEILSNFLLLEYLDSNYIRIPRLLKGSLTMSDFNAFSDANHLSKLMSMHQMYLSENETLLSRYASIGDSDISNNFSKLKAIVKRTAKNELGESW